MKAHRVEAAVERDGRLSLDGLPFNEGEMVEVIVLSRSDVSQSAERYPLRGKTFHYDAPTEPVGHGEWEAGKQSYSTPTFGFGGFMARPN